MIGSLDSLFRLAIGITLVLNQRKFYKICVEKIGKSDSIFENSLKRRVQRFKEFSNITSNGSNFNMITHFLGDGESYEHMRVNLHFSAKMCLPAAYFLPTFSDPARSTK